MKFVQIAAAGGDESVVLWALGEDGRVYEYVKKKITQDGESTCKEFWQPLVFPFGEPA